LAYLIHEDPAFVNWREQTPALVSFIQPQTPLGGATLGLTAGGGAAGVPMGSGAKPPMLKVTPVPFAAGLALSAMLVELGTETIFVPAGKPGPDTCCPAM
jgi:hypothetical protein